MIVPLTKENLPELIDGIVALSNSYCEEIKLPPLKAKDFFEDAPHKFELSFCAVENNKVIGAIIATTPIPTIGPQSKYLKRVVHIHTLAVLTDFRKQGVEQALFERLIEATRQIKLHEIRCAIQISNRKARSFYMELGFSCLQLLYDKKLNVMWLMERYV